MLLPHQIFGAGWLAERPFAILADEPGAGKAQPVSCMVATPSGWKRIGDIHAGDAVIGSAGTSVQVTGVFPQGKLDVYRVEFSDGAETRCSVDHLWAVNSHNRLTRGLKDWVVKPLSEIITPVDVRIKDPIIDKNGRRRWQVPVAKALQFNASDELPLDPYVLGCLLGDGHMKRSAVSLTKNDMQMFDEVIRRLSLSFDLTYRYELSANQRSFTLNFHGRKGNTGNKNPLIDRLREMGLQGCGSFDKFVPNIYFTASVSERLDLLRGLMDTDGTASSNICFGSRSEKLADAVLYLARSLGGIGYKNATYKVGAMFYQVILAMPDDMNPFFIERKAKDWHPREKYKPSRSIHAITPDGSEECVCIKVDAPDSLYVTDDFVITHNTAQVVTACDLINARKILVICPAVVRRHWELEFQRWSPVDRPIVVHDGRPTATPADGITIVSHATFSHRPSISVVAAGQPYDVIVVDESHELRRYGAARTRSILAPVPDPATLATADPAGAWSWARHFWCLTGTPIVNSGADLWTFAAGPMRRPEYWYDWSMRFAEEMKISLSLQMRPYGIKNADELADIFRPFMLRRTLAGIGIILPEITQRSWHIELEPDDTTLINEKLGSLQEASIMEALALGDELRDEALSTVRKILGMAKVTHVADHAIKLMHSNNGPIVIFFQHTAVRELLYDILKRHHGFRVSWIDGKVTRKQLGAAVNWYQNGFIDILLIQTEAGGMGLTLTRGTRVLFAELSWSAVAQWQAIKRVHRIGQVLPVTVDIPRANFWLEKALGTVVTMKFQSSIEFMNLIETGLLPLR